MPHDLRWDHARVSQGRPDDLLVEKAHPIGIQVLLQGHPLALGNLLLLPDDGLVQRPEKTDEIDVGFSVPVSVPVPKADDAIELGLDPRLLVHFAHDPR